VAKCDLTGKSFMTGHLISHSNRKTNTRRFANIKSKRVFDPETNTFVRMKVSTRALRTLSRKGLEAFK
jgi:large subunit ribosomal protein L28